MNQRLTLALGAASTCALVGASLIGGGGLLAWPGGEIYGHSWVQWWWGEGLDPATLAHGASGWRVIDPLITALAGVLSWNGVALGGVALAFVGGAALARRTGGSPVVGGVTLALAPIFLGSLASGLSEDAALGLVALALALMSEPEGGGTARWRARLLGGALLGLTAWCGLYLALIGAGLALLVGAVSLLRERRGWLEWLGSACLAGILTAPALLGQGERLSGEGHRLGEVVERVEPLWRINPWRGADLASFFAPGAAPLQPEDLVRLHPAYLGFAALALAVYGGWSRWWLALIAAVALSTGATLSFAGEPLGIDNPFVGALAHVPGLELLNHHGRLLLGGAIALAALAARGGARLSARFGDRAPLARIAFAGLIALEIALASPAPLPLPITPATIDPVWYTLADGDGAVLVVPMAGPGINFQRPLYEQRAHGRRLALHVNRPGWSVAKDPLGRWLSALGQPHTPPPPEAPDTAGLRRKGIRTLVVRDAYVQEVTSTLGAPTRVEVGGAVWEL